MIQWRVYYEDDSTFSNEDGSPENAPVLGVVCIVLKDPTVGRMILCRYDWYIFKSADTREPEEWSGHDIHGVLDQLMYNPGRIIACKQGRCVSDALYKTIYQRAVDDPDFPPKDAQQPGENVL